MALRKSQDSLPDSSGVQYDILQDCIQDDSVVVSQLTLLDSLFIFTSWRINCVGADIITGDGVDDHLDITEWLLDLHTLLKEDFNEVLELDTSDEEGKLRLHVGIPTIQDDLAAQVYFMSGGSGVENRINMNSNRHFVCIFKGVNDNGFYNYDEKMLLFSMLSPADLKIITEYSQRVSDVLSKIALDISMGDDINLTIDLISSLIRFMFTGNIESSLGEALYLSKKCNIGFSDYLSMSPNESEIFINNMQESESKNNNNNESSGEDLTEEYHNNF